MKILYVAPEGSIGGSALSLIGLIDQLKKENEIIVVCTHDHTQFIRELQKRNIRIIHWKYYLWAVRKPKNKFFGWIKMLLYFCACRLNYISAWLLSLYLRKENVDIVHTNVSLTNMGALVAKYSNLPHVWHIREFGKKDFGVTNLYPERYMYQFVERESRMILTVSEEVRKQYATQIKSTKLLTVYNGIETEKYYNPEKIIFANCNMIEIVMCGQILETKGQEELIDALEILKQKMKNRQFHVSFVGDGEKEYIEYLKHKVVCKNLNSRVEFVGFSLECEKFVRKADISIMASKAEAFGRVTAEALVAGCLVIGSNTGASKELLGNGRYGILYQSGDREDLASKIYYSIEHPEQMREIAQAGMRYAKETYTVEKNAEKIKQIYLSILEKKDRELHKN